MADAAPGRGRRGRPPGGGGRGPGPAGRRARRPQGQPVHTGRRRRPARRASSRAGGRPTTPPSSSRLAAAPAPSWSARPTSTSSPWASRPRTRPSARPATRTTRPGCPGGSSGGSAAAVAAGLSPRRPRLGHRRLDPPAGRAVRGGRASSRPTACVAATGSIAFASSLDQIGPFATTVADAAAAARRHRRPRPARLDVARPDRRRRASAGLGDGVDGLRVGVVSELLGRGHRRRRVRPRRRGGRRAGRRRAPRWTRSASPPRCYGAVGLLPDRAGRGVVQPGPLRRRALRPARAARGHHRR